jgi:outer membrane receptor protein involved in Fe transport
MGTTKWVAILCLTAAATASADDRSPRSLRMREPQPGRGWNPIQLGRRVAQLSSDPPPDDAPPAPSDTPPPPAADPPASTPPASTPPASTPPASTPPASPPSGNPPASSPTPPAAPAPSPARTTPPRPRLPTTTPAPEAGDEAAASGEDNGRTEVISVTDSTVEHELFTGRAPVSVVTRADLAASGRATLGDFLQALPMQANAGNAQVNAGGDGTTRISLRGLGAPRTLILINGRRVVNGGHGADAAVDINAVPLAAIERVEILKDGASALYGADAIGGVVNLITRPQFDGTDVSMLTSTSQHGDGTEYAGNFVTGFTTANKHTYLVVSGGYQRHEPVFAGDRAFSNFQNSYDFASRTVTRNASLAVPDGRIDASLLGPGATHPPGCASDACRPNASGSWSDFVAARDSYNEAPENYIYTPSSRYDVFATAGNKLNDRAAMLLEVSYLHRNSDRQLSPVPFTADSTISKDSMYNPFGADVLDYRRRMTELGPRQYVDQVSTLRVVVGITGEAPAGLGPFSDWKYEVSYNLGSTKSLSGTTGQLNKLRVTDSLGPSMLDDTATPICVRVPGDASTKIVYTVFTDGPPIIIPCVPVNLMLPAGAVPRDQLKNLTFSDAGTGTNEMHTALATTSGRLAELPNHGEIALSLGTDYREEIGEYDPPSVASAGYTTDNTVKVTQGEFHVLEGFGELNIVPISGHDIARLVEIDLGARVQRHSQFGASLTYKAGALFRTVQGIAVRGTYATAFRAPSVFDLVGGHTERTPFAEDPCDTRPPSVGDGTRTLGSGVEARCAAQDVPTASRFNTSQQTTVVGGNPELKAETAATTSLGVVYEPPQLKGLALSADYWHFDIDNAIETLGLQTIFANCYDRGLQAFCDQVHRDFNTHRITSVDQLLQNIDHTTTSGIDFALWYDSRIADLGRLHTGIEAQYLIRYDLDTSMRVIHGAGYYDLGVYPRYKTNFTASWSHPSGPSAGLTLRYVGSYRECAGNNCNDPANLATAHDVDRYLKLDLYGGYDFRSGLGRSTVQVGINNAFDAAPPVVYNAPAANSDASTYDFLGRMVYLRLSQQF